MRQRSECGIIFNIVEGIVNEFEKREGIMYTIELDRGWIYFLLFFFEKFQSVLFLSITEK